MATKKKNTLDHRERKNPRMHDLWVERKRENNRKQREARLAEKGL